MRPIAVLRAKDHQLINDQLRPILNSNHRLLPFSSYRVLIPAKKELCLNSKPLFLKYT